TSLICTLAVSVAVASRPWKMPCRVPVPAYSPVAVSTTGEPICTAGRSGRSDRGRPGGAAWGGAPPAGGLGGVRGPSRGRAGTGGGSTLRCGGWPGRVPRKPPKPTPVEPPAPPLPVWVVPVPLVTWPPLLQAAPTTAAARRKSRRKRGQREEEGVDLCMEAS